MTKAEIEKMAREYAPPEHDKHALANGPSARIGYIAGATRWAEKAEKLAEFARQYLIEQRCGETSCPRPLRAMCSNPMHKLARLTLAEWESK